MKINIQTLENLQTPTTCPKKMKISFDSIVRGLEHNGWLKSIAGEEDFNKACCAIKAMYENGRGLLITGDAGCGKTQLMKTLRKCMGSGCGTYFYCKEQEDISYMRSESPDILSEDVFIDDIGCEDIIREYGNNVDVIGDFIQRYHYRGRGRFIATTNLNSSQLNNKYGTRCLDRMLEMCVILKLNSKSKRERIII